MSQEEGVLIDIEKATMEQQQNDLEMKTQQSRQSISKAKVFSPTNADNLVSKLRLSKCELKNRGKEKLQSVHLEDEEGSGVHEPLKYSKSFEDPVLVSKEKDDEQQYFCDLIRAGDYAGVQSHLGEKGIEILNTWSMINIQLDTIPVLDGIYNEEIMCQNESPLLGLRPLHVAIVSRQKEVMETILKFIARIEESEECSAALENFLGQQSTVIFTNDLNTYDKDDRSLDGMNCFHLAARYYPGAIKIIFDTLKSEDVLYSSLLDLLLRKDKHLQQTPLHVAVRRSSKESTEAARVMLDNAADPTELANAKDYRHFTPLHYAAKSGSEINTQLILDNLSQHDDNLFYKEINAKGHRLKTPLHKARSPKVVKLLIDYDADEYLKMMEKCEGKKCEESECNCNIESPCEKGVHSVFSTLLHRNYKAAEVIINNHISTNDQELDSSDLLIVYDLKIFDPEAKHDLAEVCEDDTITVSDEMSVHTQMMNTNSCLLVHPLSQVFLGIKWKCMSKYFWITVFQYLIYLFSLSGCTMYQTWLIGMSGTNLTKCSENPPADECYFTNTLKWNESKHEVPFYCIYGLLAVSTAYLVFREFFQMCFNWPHYSRSTEDKMEALMLLLTILYLIGIFLFPVSVLRHLAAWSVFFAWIELIMLIGRFPTAGKYVHMFFSVSKTLVQYLLVYSPAILAFSLAFYILLSEKDPFLNPGNALMKTVVMLLGELDYEGNFMWVTSDNLTPHFPSIQILIMLFVLLGCIVIMNLLVGLAVDEIDVMREKGKRIRLEMVVDEIVRLEDLLVKKPSLMGCLPCCHDIIIQNHSLFQRLYKKMKDILSEKTKASCRYSKVCVRPIVPKRKEGDEKFWGTSSSNNRKSPSSFPVYFYNEETKRPLCADGQETGFTLSKELVMETIEWLKQKEEEGENGYSKWEAPTATENTDVSKDLNGLVKIRDDINKILESMDS